MDEEYKDVELLEEKPTCTPEYTTQEEATQNVITDEMVTYSKERTTAHIARVVALGLKLGFNFEGHDQTKFSQELGAWYVLIDNSYRKNLEPPVQYTREMAEASFAHIKMEHHHPEYWDPTVIMNSYVDRDSPDVKAIVNAHEMSVPAICEMVCDWVAMSLEIGGHPAEWAVKNIGSRWKFTDEQEQLIFALIGMLWTGPEANEAELEARTMIKRIVAEDYIQQQYDDWRVASDLEALRITKAERYLDNKGSQI